MKKSKILTLLLAAAVLLAFALPMTASAAAFDNAIYIEAPGDYEYTPTDAAKFKAYKIFDVTYSGTAFSYTLNPAFNGFEDYPTFGSQTLLQYLQGQSDQSKAMASIAQALYAYITGPAAVPAVGTGVLMTSGTYEGQIGIDLAKSTNANAGPGYYLVYSSITVDGQPGDTEIVAACVLTTTTPIATVRQKVDLPEINKSVANTAGGSFGKKVTADIGDDVFFKITSKVPAMVGYDDYTFIVGDKLSSTLLFDDTNATTSGMVITIGAKTLAWGTDYTVRTASTTPTADTGYTFQIVFNDFIDYAHEHDDVDCYEGPALDCDLVNRVGETITITYKAMLGAGAVIGTPGQQNTADLTYSNDPDDTGTGGSTVKTPETPPVHVYTFDFKVTKVRAADPCEDEQHEGHEECPAFVPLANAVFNLYKGTSTAGTPIDFVSDSGYRVALSTESGSPNLTSAAVTGLINVRGLDAGVYTLKEITPPDGYNALTYDIVIRISPVYDSITELLTAYTVDFQHSTGYSGNWTTADTLALNPSDYLIENSSGAELPGTGGMGEKLFILGGLAIVALFAGAIVFYKKKRTLRSVMSKA